MKKALNVVSALLHGAATIVGSIATGDWIGTADDVFALAVSLKTAVADNR